MWLSEILASNEENENKQHAFGNQILNSESLSIVREIISIVSEMLSILNPGEC